MKRNLSVDILVGTMLALIAGCGPNLPRTYPVRGTVELAQGDGALLTGSHVEAVLVGDPRVRASGEIQADGSFKLQTIQAGVILNGVPQGTYQIRLILADDHKKLQREAARLVAPRFLDWTKSGLSLEVPTTGDVNLLLSPR